METTKEIVGMVKVELTILKKNCKSLYNYINNERRMIRMGPTTLRYLTLNFIGSHAKNCSSALTVPSGE